jgi:hypothetical protein
MYFYTMSHNQNALLPRSKYGTYLILFIHQDDIWKIYLSASDPEGSMLKIVCILRKAGTPRFRPSMLCLKKEMQRQFSGYLAFHTTSALNWSGEEFVLELSILDRAGNVKGEVNFPLEFDGGGR